MARRELEFKYEIALRTICTLPRATLCPMNPTLHQPKSTLALLMSYCPLAIACCLPGRLRLELFILRLPDWRTDGQREGGTTGQPERCMLPHVGHVSHILPSWTHAGILLCTGLRRQLLPLLLLLEMMPCGSMSSCRCRSSFRAGAGAGAGSALGSGSGSCAMFAQRNTLQIVRKGAIEMQFNNAPKNARRVLEKLRNLGKFSFSCQVAISVNAPSNLPLLLLFHSLPCIAGLWCNAFVT